MATEFSPDDIALPPVPVGRFADGHQWMDQAEDFGWWVHGAWGREGWNLGTRPQVVMALFGSRETNTWALMSYVNGEVTVKLFRSLEERDHAVTEIAVQWWRSGIAEGPEDLPETGWLPHHYGPYIPGLY